MNEKGDSFKKYFEEIKVWSDAERCAKPEGHGLNVLDYLYKHGLRKTYGK